MQNNIKLDELEGDVWFSLDLSENWERVFAKVNNHNILLYKKFNDNTPIITYSVYQIQIN